MLIKPFLISMLTGLLFTFLLCKIVKKMKLTIQGIPSLGGIGVCASFVIAVLFSLPLNSSVLGILVGSVLIILLGIIDDIREISPFLKLVGQIIIVIVLIGFGIKTQISIIPSWLNSFVTILWVVGITNALNLLDILDGLAGGIAFIASLSLFLASLFTNNIATAGLSLALAGSTLGFLKFNFPPAKIYLGNCGSGFLGFALSAIAITISYAPLKREVALLSPILILGLPIYDICFVALMRLKRGRSIVKKSDDHLALRLTSLGYGRKVVLLFMYGFGFLFGVSGLIITRLTNQAGILIIIILTVLCLIVTKRMSRVIVNE